MGNLIEQCIHFVFNTIAFIFDTLTLPLYSWIQKPADVLELSNKKRAKVISRDSNHVSYESIMAIGSQHTMVVREKLDTMEKVFLHVTKLFKNKKCVGTRKIVKEVDEVQADGKILKKFVMGDYKWKSFIEAEAEATQFGKGIRELGVNAKDRVVIFAETRAEWMLAAQGLFKQACEVATIYATLGEDGIVYAINQTEVTTIITSHDLMPKLKNVLKDLKMIKTVIYFEDQLHETNTEGMGEVKVIPYQNVIALGKGSKIENVSPTKDDPAILMYTSGSTGVPKAVLLSHNNLITTMKGFLDMFGEPRSDDMYLGLLPLAHCYELLAECAVMLAAVPIGYSTPLTLIDTSLKIAQGSIGDARVLKPTIMTSVPLLLDRIAKGITAKVTNGPLFKKCLFEFAAEYKRKWVNKGYKTPLIDALVFKKVAALIGGRMRFMVSGGAPLSAGTHEMIRNCLCVTMCQGYGATETTAAGTGMDDFDLSVGRSGSPITCCVLKLVNWEEGNYFVSDKPYPRGEVIIGGDNIAKGYYKMEKETSEAFYDEDDKRWFRTGDIAEMHPDGGIKIIDRKKDLVKLQHGEYISLGKVEAELKTCQIIENLCVYCDSTKIYCIALVQPAEIGLANLAKSINVKGTYSELCKNPKVIKAATEVIIEYGKMKKLNKFEIPTKIALCEDSWSPDTGLTTAAFKIKRKDVLTKYQSEIKSLYT